MRMVTPTGRIWISASTCCDAWGICGDGFCCTGRAAQSCATRIWSVTASPVYGTDRSCDSRNGGGIGGDSGGVQPRRGRHYVRIWACS